MQKFLSSSQEAKLSILYFTCPDEFAVEKENAGKQTLLGKKNVSVSQRLALDSQKVHIPVTLVMKNGSILSGKSTLGMVIPTVYTS